MSVAWLRDLEDRVREIAARLEETRSENERLQTRIAELEAAAAAGEDPDAASWSEERDEIRRRVEGLVGHLESLLGDDAG